MYPNILKLATQTKISPRNLFLLQANYTRATTQLFSKPSAGDGKQIALQPVPKLADTMQRFLESCKPLLTADEMQETMCQAESFMRQDSVGCELQQLLLEKAKRSENWLADWWLRAAYLDYRSSLVGWSNPGAPYAFKKLHCEAEWLDYSARIVLGALMFKKKIDDGNLKQEMMGKYPLDMQQYCKVLGTCRIPGEKGDCLQFNPNSKHIVVLCNNHFYTVSVYDDNDCPISLKQLIKQLKMIVDNSKEPAAAVGVLTATNRDTWAKTYKLLKKDKCNQACLRHIHESLFVLCLDKMMPEMKGMNDLTIAGLLTIHGGGTQHNTGNRWFDKCVQLVVNFDGYNGITYEHSPAEGGPVMVMGDFIQDYLNTDNADQTSDIELKEAVPRELKFELNEKLCEAICLAGEEVDKYICDFDLQVIKFDSYGKEFIKSMKLSPDSYIQMCLQYAYHRLHCKPAAHYEAAALRHFLHGRTETIRSCSCESLAFAQTMQDECATSADKVEALKTAINAHKNYVKAALSGNGVDRHLLGLRLLGNEQGCDAHPFYKTPGYLKSTTFMLTTSQVATKYEGFMGFGPVHVDGYGVCYNPRKEDMIISVSSLRSSKESSTKDMVKMIACCFEDMKTVLCSAVKSKL